MRNGHDQERLRGKNCAKLAKHESQLSSTGKDLIFTATSLAVKKVCRKVANRHPSAIVAIFEQVIRGCKNTSENPFVAVNFGHRLLALQRTS